jgi:hypothetical protein
MMYNLRENTQRTFQVGSRFPMVTNGCWYCLTLPYLREISWIGRVEIADSMTVLVDKTRTTCTYPSPAPGFTSDVFCKTRTTCIYPSPAPGVTSDVLYKTRTTCTYLSPAPGFTSDVFCKTRTTCTYPSPAPGVTSDVLCNIINLINAIFF